MKSFTTPKFWKAHAALPKEIGRTAHKQFLLWQQNQSHPSLQFKKIGRVWSVRVTEDSRALCYPKDGDYYWFWIGKHSEYEELIKGK